MTAKTDTIRLNYGFLSDIGYKRQTNQDSYAVLSRSDLGGRLDGLFVVADGMGGARGGEVASRIVVQSLPEAVDALLRQPVDGQIDADKILYNAIAHANHNVYTRKVESQGLRGMGTTCVCAIVSDGRITVGNVGDSRAYLLRKGLLTQLTEDHSEVFDQVKAGQMTREEARTSKFRNRITRFIGFGPDVEPDVNTWPLEEGDAILICSDGLMSELRDDQIARILATVRDPQETSERLVSAALQHGGSDNVTVVVMHYGVFIPLELPATDVDEEPDTDRDARWRKARGKAGNHRPLRAPVRRQGGGWESPVIALLISALAVSLVAIYLLWNGTIKPNQEIRAAPGPSPARPSPPPPSSFAYRAEATVVYKKTPLLDNVLDFTPQGNLLVVTADGDIIVVTPQGAAQNVSQVSARLFSASGNIAGSSDPENMESGATSGRHSNGVTPQSPVDVALDGQGNRYQICPRTHWIEQLTQDGKSINASIGKGTLIAPTRLVVSPLTGDIYVIDKHQLKRIVPHRR